MSDFPPPNVGPGNPTGGATPAPPPPPPTPPSPPGGYGYQPNLLVGEPTTGGSKKRGLIVASIVVVAALAVGGAYIAIRDDGDSASGTTATDSTTEETDAPDTTVVVTEAPDTTAVDTTAVDTTEVATTEVATTVESTTTTTEPATTTTAFSVPDGSIDLGHDVFLPVPEGWSQINEPDAPVLISDGVTKFGVQVLARQPGEDITALVQEYTNTFDTVYGATSFGPTRFVGPVEPTNEAILEINEYATLYTTYDAGDAVGLAGAIDTLVRGDGLSVVIDAFSTSDAALTIPQDAYDTLVKTFGVAPSLGPTAPLAGHDPFRVTSVTPVVEVEGLVGFSLAPGFTVVTAGTAGGAYALTSTGAEDFSVIKIAGQADVNTVIATAQANLTQTYSGVAYTEATADAADRYGVLHGEFTWTGLYLDGQPSAGSINYYFDPASGNAFIVFRSWYTTFGPDEPSLAEAEFMTRSLYASITTIP